MVVEIHEKPIYVVSILIGQGMMADWKDIMCTTHIDRAVANGNEWLERGVDVSIRSWTTELDYEPCTVGKEENCIFIGDDDNIITWKEKENK